MHADDWGGLGPALLFCPGNRPERFVKAAERSDGVIVDLEDAVPVDQKEDARRAVGRSDLDPDRTLVRVNSGSPRELDRDLAALAGTGFRRIVAGKCESVDELDVLTGFDVVPQIETPLGLLRIEAIAAHSAVVAVFWGTEDFVQLLGGVSGREPDGDLIDPLRHARSRVLIAAAAFGKPAIDAPFTDYSDSDGLAHRAAAAARSGFTASACVHPNQVRTVRDAYRPDAEAVARAQELVARAAQADGAFASGGAMIDAPIVLQAQRVLARAAALPPL
ncbi:HpcH/HpaI aldolase/citrate lyase family protein [Gryllotalpicola reticulitermitis]|uniref:HpcH/HpaI aldolase/citrate lyase family protein n=1 Tax=Gryllotalpicola reticulitermitis TaxID=1184153 RepID=A0ABV8Q0H9_9MICO